MRPKSDDQTVSRRAARLRYRGPILSEPAVAHCRNGIRRSVMQELLGSLRYAIRQFRRSPVFTAAAVLTLALGIGGTTASFTLIHAVTTRSLPVTHSARAYRGRED